MSATVHAVPVPPIVPRAGQHAVHRLLTRRTALPISIVVALLVGLGDYVTGADVAFTLLYLLPVGIASWYRGRIASVVMCGLCGALWLFVTITTSTSALPHDVVLAWNVLGQAGVFVAFGALLRALRVRLDVEVLGRESAVEQLRHAERLSTVGVLASGLAHELGTPLNVISGRASLVASGRVAGDDARTSATIIIEQTSRMARIIRNLLDFARSGNVRRAPVDVARLTHDAVALLEPLASRRGCKLEFDDGSPVLAAVDAGQLQQVITNLLMNAIQATPGGRTIRVTVREERSAERPAYATPSNTYAVIRVRDEGTGIPPEVLPRVFDPFFTTKDVGEGTGLGLSVAFGIVRDHGGWISVRSKVGEGSAFVVYLPQTPAS